MDEFRTRRAQQLSTELNGMLEEDQALAMADLEDDATRLFYLRQERAEIEHNEKTIDPSASEYGRMGRLRRWLTDHPGEKVIAGEYGIEAFLRDGGTFMAYDSPTEIKKSDPSLFERLLGLGCLEIDPKMVEARIKQGQLFTRDLAPYRHEMGRTPSLRTERKEP